MTWGTLLDHLRGMVGLTQTALRTRLHGVEQGGDSLREYALRCEQLREEAGVEEEEAKASIIAGLSAEGREALDARLQEKYGTLAAASTPEQVLKAIAYSDLYLCLTRQSLTAAVPRREQARARGGAAGGRAAAVGEPGGLLAAGIQRIGVTRALPPPPATGTADSPEAGEKAEAAVRRMELLLPAADAYETRWMREHPGQRVKAFEEPQAAIFALGDCLQESRRVATPQQKAKLDEAEGLTVDRVLSLFQWLPVPEAR